MARVILLFALLFASRLNAAELSHYVLIAHTSDYHASNTSEVTQDFIGYGVEICFTKSRVCLEGALGRKATNCKAFTGCGSSPGGYAAMRWHIGKLRPRADRSRR